MLGSVIQLPHLLLTEQRHTPEGNQERTMHFCVGDVVYLISFPSHRMTVVEIDGFEIVCRWLEGAAVKEGAFPAHLLADEGQPEPMTAETWACPSEARP
jgi:uncharacterized protein YodC (DUF2158 family)